MRAGMRSRSEAWRFQPFFAPIIHPLIFILAPRYAIAVISIFVDIVLFSNNGTRFRLE